MNKIFIMTVAVMAVSALSLAHAAMVRENIYTHPGNTGVVLYPKVDRIIILGDGMISGEAVGKSRSLEQTLARFLRMAGYVDTQVISLAEPKLNTSAAKLKMPSILEYYKPSIVVMALGREDMIRGEKLTHSMALMDEMISQLRKAGSDVLLVGIDPPNDVSPFYATRLPEVYEFLRIKHALPFYPRLRAALDGDEAMFLKDKEHPSPRGIRAIASQLQPYIVAMLERIYDQRRLSEEGSFYTEELQ